MDIYSAWNSLSESEKKINFVCDVRRESKENRNLRTELLKRSSGPYSELRSRSRVECDFEPLISLDNFKLTLAEWESVLSSHATARSVSRWAGNRTSEMSHFSSSHLFALSLIRARFVSSCLLINLVNDAMMSTTRERERNGHKSESRAQSRNFICVDVSF